MDNKICVYAIAKNEEKFVKRWYESMKEADLVVVLDTGSTDNTVEALKEVGVDIVKTKVIDPWRFDVARNESLKLVPEGYNILVCTDLDEVFEPGWANKLRENWNDNIHERAHYTYIWGHNSDGSPNVMYYYNKIHTRNWKWRAAVHEYLTRVNDEKNFTYGLDVTLNLVDSITLHHYPDPTKSRSSYLSLLEIRAKELEQDDPISLVYLGREYWFYNKFDEAIEVLNKTITIYSKVLDKLVLSFCCLMIGNCYASKALNSVDDKDKKIFYGTAKKYHRHGIDINDKFMENYTSLAEVAIMENEYYLAKKILETGFGYCERKNSWMEDGANWTYRPLELLAIASYKLGDKANAITYAAKALSYEPNNLSLHENLNNILSNSSINELIK